MALASGRLRHRIQIQEQIQTVDPITLVPSFTWRKFADVWAAIEPLSVKEFVAAQVQGSQVTGRFVIRARDGVNANQRILHRGKVYNIHGVLPDKDSGIEYFTLPYSEGISADGA